MYLRGRQSSRTASHQPSDISPIIAIAQGQHWDALFPNLQLGARHLEAYVGPTNSGKTYQALQALKSLRPHEQGVYLAPLRLLAIEVCEELRSQGVPASLLTGEERDIDQNARVVCSTIEMLDTSQQYDVAVIDEMQMLMDEQRGWAWTRALFELSADRVFILGSTAVEPLLTKFAESTGDSLSVHHTQRFTPLNITPKHIDPTAIAKGTIFVVFSRNSVIRWGERFRNHGHSVAHIYGAMPPEVRRAEAARFRDGSADILVATDAIAMGLNLPAHTVIMGEGEKFNGRTSIDVPPSLIRQIVGRAGRYGHHDVGFAAGASPAIHRQIQEALGEQDDAIQFPSVFASPTREWVDRVVEMDPNLSTGDLLRAWKATMQDSRWFTCIDLNDAMSKAVVLDGLEDVGRLSMEDRLHILAAPVDARAGQMRYFRSMVSTIINESFYPSPVCTPGSRVDELESDYKYLSLYCWFHYRYPKSFPDIQKATAERAKCVEKLILQVRKGVKRYCRSCGAILSSQNGYSLCNRCHTSMHARHW